MSSAMDEESDEDIWITQETFRVNPSENLACDPEFISILNDLKKPPILEENDVVKRVKGSGSNVVFNNCILNFDTFQTH